MIGTAPLVEPGGGVASRSSLLSSSSSSNNCSNNPEHIKRKQDGSCGIADSAAKNKAATSSGDPRLTMKKSSEPPQNKESAGAGAAAAHSTTTAATSTTSNQQTQPVLLPLDFVPGNFDVWCGRGRACKNAPGNLAYRQACLDQLQAYAASTTKLQKGIIITEIVAQVRRKCHAEHGALIGGFVKKNSSGRWTEVGDFLAREKTSQAFRDALSNSYSSSAQSKYQKRRAREQLSLSQHNIATNTAMQEEEATAAATRQHHPQPEQSSLPVLLQAAIQQQTDHEHHEQNRDSPTRSSSGESSSSSTRKEVRTARLRDVIREKLLPRQWMDFNIGICSIQ